MKHARAGMKCLLVQTLERKTWFCPSTGCWRLRASDKSCDSRSSLEASTRRLQCSSSASGRWSWRRRSLTAKIRNFLFRFSQLQSVCCSTSATRRVRTDTEKKRKVQSYKRNSQVCSLRLQGKCDREFQKHELLQIVALKNTKFGKKLSAHYGENSTI